MRLGGGRQASGQLWRKEEEEGKEKEGECFFFFFLGAIDPSERQVDADGDLKKGHKQH